jgi:hypothetical protein
MLMPAPDFKSQPRSADSNERAARNRPQKRHGRTTLRGYPNDRGLLKKTGPQASDFRRVEEAPPHCPTPLGAIVNLAGYCRDL